MCCGHNRARSSRTSSGPVRMYMQPGDATVDDDDDDNDSPLSPSSGIRFRIARPDCSPTSSLPLRSEKYGWNIRFVSLLGRGMCCTTFFFIFGDRKLHPHVSSPRLSCRAAGSVIANDDIVAKSFLSFFFFFFLDARWAPLFFCLRGENREKREDNNDDNNKGRPSSMWWGGYNIISLAPAGVRLLCSNQLVPPLSKCLISFFFFFNDF